MAARHPVKGPSPLRRDTKTQKTAVEEKVPFDLKNAQPVVVALDGVRPLPPICCYLKPDFLPADMSWFDQEQIAFDPARYKDEFRSYHPVPQTHRTSAFHLYRLRDHGESRWKRLMEEKAPIELVSEIQFDEGVFSERRYEAASSNIFRSS